MINMLSRSADSSVVPVEHCVKGGDLVDAHARHFQVVGDIVHSRDGQPTILALSEIQKRNQGGI